MVSEVSDALPVTGHHGFIGHQLKQRATFTEVINCLLKIQKCLPFLQCSGQFTASRFTEIQNYFNIDFKPFLLIHIIIFTIQASPILTKSPWSFWWILRIQSLHQVYFTLTQRLYFFNNKIDGAEMSCPIAGCSLARGKGMNIPFPWRSLKQPLQQPAQPQNITLVFVRNKNW